MIAVPQDESGRFPPKNPRSKCMIAAIVVLSLLCVTFLILFLVHLFVKPLVRRPSDICITRDCTQTASTLIQAMDPSANPCKDFYQFTCGNFMKDHLVPDEEVSASSFGLYKTKYQRQQREIIESIDASKEPDVVFRAQEAYHVCLNVSYQEPKELRAFKKFVKEFLDGWPIAEENWKPKLSLEEFIGRYQRLGFVSDIINVQVMPDIEDPTHGFIAIDPTREDHEFMARRTKRDAVNDLLYERREQKKIIAAYKKLITSMARELGNLKDDDEVDHTEAFDMIIFPGRVSQMRQSITEEEYDDDEDDDDEEEDDENGTAHPNGEDEEDEAPSPVQRLTVNELNKLSQGKLDWVKLLNATFHGNRKITKDDMVMIEHTAYIEKVTEFLTGTKRSTLANHMIYELLLTLLPTAGGKMEQAYYELLKVLVESYVEPQRWVTCVDWMKKTYPLVMSRLFVRTYVDSGGRDMADEIIQLLQKAYKETIGNSQWLDKETKARALIKANAMKRFVSYPDLIFDDKQLEKEYADIPVVHSVHLSNMVGMMENRTMTSYHDGLTKPKEQLQRWNFDPLQINAFYHPIRNSIWFPSGILQLPFFDVTRPAMVNFAMIGTVTGHEIGHGYDNSGRQFDEKGRLKDWWTKDAAEKYKKRADCYEKQYSAFCPEELRGGDEDICVDGNQTLGENIADNTGLKASYLAYKMWVDAHGEEKRLPGLEKFTSEQLFFISYGYIWCENVPPENWLRLYKSNSHSAGRYRVIGAVANSKEFADAFNCPVGPMNRGKDRCELW